MSETVEVDLGLNKLEQLHAAKVAKASVPVPELESEFDEDEPDSDIDLMERASYLIRTTWVLLEYLINPDFVKTITKRERNAIEKHLTKLYAMEIELDAAVDEQDGEEEDE